MEDKDISKKLTSIINKQINELDAIMSSVPLLDHSLLNALVQNSLAKNLLLEEHGILKDGEGKKYSLSEEWIAIYLDFERRKTRLEQLKQRIMPSFLVTMISLHDDFISKIIAFFYEMVPEKIKTDKTITLADLMKSNNIDDIKKKIVNDEIDKIMRCDHSKHINYICDLIDMNFEECKKRFHDWKGFIEITQRRHLFVHTGGVVNNYYLENCKEHNFETNSKLGDTLNVDLEYIEKAGNILIDISLKITHMIWRCKAIRKNEEIAEQADNHIIGTVYDLIEKNRHDIAVIVSKDALNSIKKWSKNMYKKRIIINCAQAYLWMENKDKCIETLKSEDWSDSSNDFKLAVAVLLENYQEASGYMRKIGNHSDSEIKEAEYHVWPLFRDFRKSSIFKETYKEIFEKDFINNQIEDLNADKNLNKSKFKIDNIHSKTKEYLHRINYNRISSQIKQTDPKTTNTEKKTLTRYRKIKKR